MICSLTAPPIDSTPSFQTISYCWGDEEATENVVCIVQGIPGILKVTPHLYEGLRCIFSIAGSTVVWIDAICINQSDDDEKNVQVAQMGSVYASAGNVFVWLGLAQDGSNELFDALTRFWQYLEDTHIDLAQLASAKARGDVSALFPTLDKLAWRALAFFFRRPWFQRLWIVQEIVLAQTVSVACGMKQISWEQLYLLSKFIKMYDIRQPWSDTTKLTARKAMLFIFHLNRIREDREQNKDPIVRLLRLGYSQATTEPIDRSHLWYLGSSCARYQRAYPC